MFPKTLKSAGLALLAVGSLGLAACESYGPTPYQAAGSQDRGYSETLIEGSRYRISFKGNSLTDRDTVENYLLFRASELTLQSGFDTFTIVNRDTDAQRRLRNSGSEYYGTRLDYLYFHPRYGWIGAYSPVWGPSTYREVTQYEASAEVVMSNGPKGSDVNAFNAREVSTNLGSLITRPPQ